LQKTHPTSEKSVKFASINNDETKQTTLNVAIASGIDQDEDELKIPNSDSSIEGPASDALDMHQSPVNNMNSVELLSSEREKD